MDTQQNEIYNNISFGNINIFKSEIKNNINEADSCYMGDGG